MIDYTTMIGPIILIDVTARPVGKTRLCCPDEQCERYWKSTKANFCSICGKEIMEHHYEVLQDVTWYDFLRSLYTEDDDEAKVREFEDAFHCPEYLGTDDKIVVISNLTRSNRDLGENNFVLLSNVSTTVNVKLREFKDEWVDHISVIEDFFGQGNVDVEYGVCSYTM